MKRILAPLIVAAVLAAQPRSEPRVLSATDLWRLTRLLTPFKGQKVSLAHGGTDAEAVQLADQLDEILHRAGWVQPGPVGSGGAGARDNSSGIDLTVPERTRASDALWNGLLAAGLDVTAHLNPAAVPHGSISIFVYSRP